MIKSIDEDLPSLEDIWWEENPQELRALDFPPIHATRYLIDLYYENYHHNHGFLLPKRSMFIRFEPKVDAGILHAMFSVSCRFSDPKKCDELGLSAYHRDPMYWISIFEKRRSALHSILLIKGLLLIGTAYAISCDHEKSFEIAQEASELCRWHNLDKRFRSTADSIGPNSEAELRLLNPQQLVFLESQLRTLWEVWKLQVDLAFIANDPNRIPAFNGDLGMPVSDTIYESEFKEWNYERKLWRDLDNDLLNSYHEAGETLVSQIKKDVTVEQLENSLWCGTCVHIVCKNLMALAFKHRKQISSQVQWTFDMRLKVLFSKLPPPDVALAAGGGYLLAHGALHLATLLLHVDRARSFVVYLFDVASDLNSAPVTVCNSEQIMKILKAKATTEGRSSYLTCQWAIHWLCVFIKGEPLTPELSSKQTQWRRYSALTSFILKKIVPLLGTELLMIRVSESLGLSLARSRVDTFLEFPKFHLESAPPPRSSVMSVPSPSSIGDSEGTAIEDYSTTYQQPFGTYGDRDQVQNKLSMIVKLEEFLSGMWPKMVTSCKISKFIQNHAETYVLETGSIY